MRVYWLRVRWIGLSDFDIDRYGPYATTKEVEQQAAKLDADSGQFIEWMELEISGEGISQ